MAGHHMTTSNFRYMDNVRLLRRLHSRLKPHSLVHCQGLDGDGGGYMGTMGVERAA